MSDDGQVKVRLSKELKSTIEEQAKRNHRTLNGEIVFLLEQVIYGNKNAQVKVIYLDNGIKRVVYGSLVNRLDIDYTNPSLDELRDDIDYCLDILANSNSLRTMMMFFNKKVLVYKGGHHIDVVDDGKGSLGWLRVEDHWTEKVTSPY